MKSNRIHAPLPKNQSSIFGHVQQMKKTGGGKNEFKMDAVPTLENMEILDTHLTTKATITGQKPSILNLDSKADNKLKKDKGSFKTESSIQKLEAEKRKYPARNQKKRNYK
jgi:hypothetical protein